MIIYALIITSALFFLAWNLIDNRKIHFIASLITTLLFLVTVFFAVANFKDHYGMHKVTEPQQTQQIKSISPRRSLKMLVYRPMGNSRKSQIVIYKNKHNKVVHTASDLKVTNQIVQNSKITKPHVVTSVSKWIYSNSTSHFWFYLAKKPSTYRVRHTFYVPNSWRVLSMKQTLALKQIIKNRSGQLEQKANSPQAEHRIRQQAMMYVKSQEMDAIHKNPKLSVTQKKLVAKRATKDFKAKMKQKLERKLISEADRKSVV